MKQLNFTIIKLCFFLVVGILLSELLRISIVWISFITFGILALLGIILYTSKKQFHKTIWFGTIAYVMTIVIGILITNLHKEKLFARHYSNFLTEEISSQNTIIFSIKERLKPTIYNEKYIIEIIKIDTINVIGKALLNLKKDQLPSKLQVDEIYFTTESLTEIQPPLNPNQFNYKSYLEKRHIHHQIFSEQYSLFHIHNNLQSLNGYANAIRNSIQNKLKSYNFHPDELAIINALILGQRQDISKAIYKNYTNSGAVHILAVSGLHVGILLFIMNALFKPIERFKKGKLIKAILIIVLLWSYTVLAGGSASIVRAATMFSVIAIGMHLKRPSNIYNTLAVSAFIILLFKPYFLFDVGFQLSYLAVIGIVSIQPLLNNLWKPKLWLINKLWQVFTVTIAAQFGVIPISLYYFHQFPGLFWLTNIVVVPLLGIILTSGILVIIMAILNILPQILANSYGYSISLMNSFFEWISNQKGFLIEDIPFNMYQVFMTYLIIVVIVHLYTNRSYKCIKLFLLSVISFQIVSFCTKYNNSKDAFIVFHKTRNSVIGIKNGKTLEIFHNLDTLFKNQSIKTYAIGNDISNITYETIKSFITFNNKTILLIDSLGIYNIKSIKPDYILLRNSPKINLNRLIDSLEPAIIIVDGSNYKSYIQRWEATCKKRKLPFHYTGKKGAFILKN